MSAARAQHLKFSVLDGVDRYGAEYGRWLVICECGYQHAACHSRAAARRIARRLSGRALEDNP